MLNYVYCTTLYGETILINLDRITAIKETRDTDDENSEVVFSRLWTGDVSAGDIEIPNTFSIDVKEDIEFFRGAINAYNNSKTPIAS